jgi:hypothetical protein
MATKKRSSGMATNTSDYPNPVRAWSDYKFVNSCYDSLAADDPIYMETDDGEKITCIEYLLNVPMSSRGSSSDSPTNVAMYQFGRDDIDLTKPYCKNGDGVATNCISRIVEFHSSNINRRNNNVDMYVTGSPKGVDPTTIAPKNMSKFFTRYHDLIVEEQCETVHSEIFRTHGNKEYASCLNKLFEVDPYFGVDYYPEQKDFEFGGCSTYVNGITTKLSCLEKIIVEGLSFKTASYSGLDKIHYKNAKRLLSNFISRGDREYKFNNKMLTSRPIGDPFGYTTYIDLLTDTRLRVNGEETSNDFSGSTLIYSYLFGAGGHKYDVPGLVLDINSKFCIDRETREPIPCLEKMLIESLHGYNRYGSQWITSIKELIKHPHFQSKPCALLALVSKHTVKEQYNDTRGVGSGESVGTMLEAVAPTFKDILNTKGLTCPSWFTGEQVPVKEYGLELAVPIIAVTNIEKTVQNGKMFTGDCTSIEGNKTVTCWEKMVEMLSRDTATYGTMGTSEANFGLVNYAMRVPFRLDKSVVPDILEHFNEAGVISDGTFKDNWKDLLVDIIEYRGDDMVGNMCADGKTVLEHVITDMDLVFDRNSKSSRTWHDNEVMKAIRHKGMSKEEKHFVTTQVLPKLQPDVGLETVATWIWGAKKEEDVSDLCDIMKSKPDWVSALTAMEKQDKHGEGKEYFQVAYEKCFGAKYPDALGYTAEARKIFDYLCFERDGLDENELVQDIIGIEPGNPDSLTKASTLKEDPHDIVGIYDVNTNESWNEDDIEKYAKDVSRVWYGTGNEHGLSQLLNMSEDFHGSHPPLTSNMGTRDTPIKAYIGLTIEPIPELEYHDVFRTVNAIRTGGDFLITVHYLKPGVSKYDSDFEYDEFQKEMMFSNIITDLPKSVRNYISKNAPKLFNQMQNVANAVRVKKPSEGRFKLVISNKSADLARATSCQPWESKSCLNLESGCYRGAIKTYAHFGSYIAYLVNDNPYEPQWLGRLLIHKCTSHKTNNEPGTVQTLSIQDSRSHYTTKPKYWGIVYDAVRTIFADKGINQGVNEYCSTWSWARANDRLIGNYQDLCDEEIDTIINDSDEMSDCVDNCMDRKRYDDDTEDEVREGCAEDCEQNIRDNFNCADFLEGYFEDDDESPLYVNYVDTSSIQRIDRNSKTYSNILKQRINDATDSSKFVKKVESTF